MRIRDLEALLPALSRGGAESTGDLGVAPAPPAWVWSLPCRWQDSHWLQDTAFHSLFQWQESGYPTLMLPLCSVWTCSLPWCEPGVNRKPTSAWTQS